MLQGLKKKWILEKRGDGKGKWRKEGEKEKKEQEKFGSSFLPPSFRPPLPFSFLPLYRN